MTREENGEDVNIREIVESMDKIELIDTLESAESVKKEVVLPYLAGLYDDLILRSESREKGIPKVVLTDFLHLPGLIGERVFAMFDANRDGFAGKEEFINASCGLISQKFEDNLKLVFDIYDFDGDKVISREDIRTLLSHVPLSQILADKKVEGRKEGAFTRGGGGFEVYLDRVQSQQELAKLLNFCMKDKDKINIEEFTEITEKLSCEMFLCIFLLMRSQIPFFKDIPLYASKIKKSETKVSSPTTSTLLSSPKMLSKFAPVASMVKNSPKLTPGAGKGADGPRTSAFLTKFAPNSEDSKESKLVEEVKSDRTRHPKPSNAPWIDVSKIGDCVLSPNMNTEVVRLPNVARINQSALQKAEESKTDIIKSPSLVLRDVGRDSTASVTYCACGNPCEGDNSLCATCIRSKETIEMYGYLYLKTKSTKLKRYWFSMLNKELYCYKNKEDAQYKRMHSLTGTFIKDELEDLFDKKTVLYPFSLYFMHNKVTFYAIKKEEKVAWMKALKEAIGYASLYDYYELKETLGKGKFGVVRLGIHKKTQKRVAVKIMKKGDMTTSDIELVRREIEILKLCQHPNIIRLLDVFENPDYIYIVMELLRGGDLFTYLEKRGFKISEARACNIVHSLATALYYLHSYGIAHRDVKPENVLMVDESEDSDVKIVDFGLSKMVGPNEKCYDPFGTLSYVAPEVLLQQPYDKSVDIWSLGVVGYLLLSGTLPYDDDEEKEIVRQTIYDPPDFTHQGWKGVSKEAVHFVSKLMVKDKSRRLALTQILEHPWITKYCLGIREMRQKAQSVTQFKVYSHQQPHSPKILDEVMRRTKDEFGGY